MKTAVERLYKHSHAHHHQQPECKPPHIGMRQRRNTPPSPKTRPNVERAREYEKRLDIEGLMQRALDGIEITEIHPGEDYLNQNEDVFAELL